MKCQLGCGRRNTKEISGNLIMENLDVSESRFDFTLEVIGKNEKCFLKRSELVRLNFA